MKKIILISFCLSLPTIAMETTNNKNDEESRAEHRQRHQEWVLADKKSLEDLDFDLKNYFETNGNELFLIDRISSYLYTYNSMIPELYLYRGVLYKRIKKPKLAIEDLKTSLSLSPFRNYSDIRALLLWANINFEAGEYEKALNTLEHAKNSGFCTIENRKEIDNNMISCMQKMGLNRNF